ESRRRHTRLVSDWSSDVCSSDLGINKGETFEHDSELAHLLMSILVLPLIELQAAFDQKWATLLHILRNHFRLPAKGVNVNKGHLFLQFARLGLPLAIG